MSEVTVRCRTEVAAEGQRQKHLETELRGCEGARDTLFAERASKRGCTGSRGASRRQGAGRDE